MNASHGTLLIADQMTGLLESLDQAIFTQPLPLFHGSTIGQHVRHILEFYTCLLDGMPAAHVDYSSRKRNNALSENLTAALVTLEYIAVTVGNNDERQWLKVDSEFSEEDNDRPAYISSMGRELQYAFDHAVHHLAIIRMGLEVHFPEIPVDADLGVAPSTLRYRKVGKKKTAERRVIPETTYG